MKTILKTILRRKTTWWRRLYLKDEDSLEDGDNLEEEDYLEDEYYTLKTKTILRMETILKTILRMKTTLKTKIALKTKTILKMKIALKVKIYKGPWRQSWRWKGSWRWSLSMQGCALASLQWSNYRCNNLRMYFGLFAMDVHWLLAMILFKGIKWRVPDFRDMRWHHSKFKYERRWRQNSKDLRWSNSAETLEMQRDATKFLKMQGDKYHQDFKRER